MAPPAYLALQLECKGKGSIPDPSQFGLVGGGRGQILTPQKKGRVLTLDSLGKEAKRLGEVQRGGREGREGRGGEGWFLKKEKEEENFAR